MQISQPLRRKKAVQFSTKKNLFICAELPEPKDDTSDSSSETESDSEELSMEHCQTSRNQQFRTRRNFVLLKHVLVFLLRITQRLEYRRLYGVPKYTLNPHFMPLELIRRNLNYNSQGYGVGLSNDQSTMSLAAKQKKKPRLLFYPKQLGIQIWHLANIVTVCFLLIYVPPSIAFAIDNHFFIVINYIIDLFFIADLILNFNITFELPDGSFETNRWAIAKKYLLGHFVVDLLVSFPVSWIIERDFNAPIQYNKALRALKVPKLMATLRLTKRFDLPTIFMILKLGNMWKYKIKSNEGFFKILWMIMLVFLAVHIGACIWIIIGSVDIFDSHTWIIQESLTRLSDAELYVAAVYYCLVVFTTVGYGDIYSANSLERCFTILWMMFGIGFYSFVISFIMQHFTNIDTPKTLFAKKLKQLKSLTDYRHIPSGLFDAVRKNLRYASTVISYRWVEYSKSFYQHLPLELKYNFSRELHREVLKSPFFDSNNDAFAVRILERLKPVKLKRNQFMWSKDDIPSNIVFIVEGKMFYMMDNIYYSRPEKRKQEEKTHQLQFIQIDSERRSLTRDELQENQPSKKSVTTPRRSFRNLIKMFNLFGQKDVKKTFSDKNTAESEFKNYAQIRKHLLVDPSSTSEIRDLPLVSFRLFGTGSYLGEEEILWPAPRKYYLKAATDVQLMVLARTDFEKIVKEEFPQIYKKISDHAILRIGWFDKMKRSVLKRIYTTLKKTDSKQFYTDTKIIIEKSANKIRKEREIYQAPRLDAIIETTEDANLLQNLMPINPGEVFEPNKFGLEKTFARERANSPGLMKMYSNWHSRLIRAAEGKAIENGEEFLGGNSRQSRGG